MMVISFSQSSKVAPYVECTTWTLTKMITVLCTCIIKRIVICRVRSSPFWINTFSKICCKIKKKNGDFTLTCSRPRRPIIITDEDLWDEMWADENLNYYWSVKKIGLLLYSSSSSTSILICCNPLYLVLYHELDLFA